MKHVALLRGINVGGKNIIPMKALAALFTAAGCRDVATCIQSGNVIFTAPPSVLKKLPATVSNVFNVPAMIRSHDELAAAMSSWTSSWASPVNKGTPEPLDPGVPSCAASVSPASR